MNEELCRRRTLAKSPVCRVDVCGCGMLHVTLGALTIRIEPRAGEEIVETLGRALEELATESGQPREGHPWNVGSVVPKPKILS